MLIISKTILQKNDNTNAGHMKCSIVILTNSKLILYDSIWHERLAKMHSLQALMILD